MRPLVYAQPVLFPLNTNGGGLSYTHTGMYGMFAIQESVRQLRGEAAAQLPDVRTSIAHGVGGMFHAAGTPILTNDERALTPLRRSASLTAPR